MERRMREAASRRCPPGAPLSAGSPHHRSHSDPIDHPRASEARFLLRSRDPVKRLVRDAVLSEKKAQSFFFFSHRLPPKAVKRRPHIGYREMRRQVEDQLGLSFSRHAHQAASPNVKPESNDPPPLCERGVNDNGPGAGAL